MTALNSAVALLYVASAVMVAVYGCAQLHLLWRSRAVRRPQVSTLGREGLPRVLVQLPVRNERRVMRPLLRCIAGLDWPSDRLEIQVLDDSDDETVGICAEECARLRARGVRIEHVRRAERRGFKAGALAHGLTLNDADYVAIFDADFRPDSSFLREAMAVLIARPELGLVQARWAHLNRDHSPFTQALAFHLDAHFGVEQQARSQQPLLMGFNGTAGIWRRAAIDGAGGWSADSLTEDLDLSFRAQLAGWPLAYVDELEAPAELPADVRAIRTQQHRWMKGGAQVFRKLIGPLWASDRPLVAKLQGTAHLGGGTVFLAVTALLLVTPALAFPAVGEVMRPIVWPAALLLQVALVVLALFYGTSCVRRAGFGRGLARFALTFLPFLALSTGLALHNAVAVVDGWSGRPSPFVRTPKLGEDGDGGKLYVPLPVGRLAFAELLLAGWAVVGLMAALFYGDWLLAGFLLSQAAGCGVVALGGWFPSRTVRAWA
ncbi:MAG: glycosyltransferase [Proteobacteria bacterium]|nr:glycosyltransferase [Pseudomonadota bacterium]